MSKLTADRFGNVVIESGLTTAKINRAQKYVPAALDITDENDNPLFGICISKGDGSADKNGVAFGGTTTDGYAFVSIPGVKLPTETDAKASALQEKFGHILFKLNAVEGQINRALDAVDGQIASVADSITVE